MIKTINSDILEKSSSSHISNIVIDIIDLIEPNLMNWKFSRLNLLTQSIFLLAVSHYQYVKEVDKKIVIDNAVKLAKKYVDVKDYAFVNAILDKVL